MLDIGENIATKNKDKAKVLKAFLTSIINSQTSCPKEHNEAPTIQQETVTCFSTETCKSMGLDGIHLRVLRELSKPLSMIHQ